MKITVVQPTYIQKENPCENIRRWLLDALKQLQPGALMVLPEYSNAGGTSDPKEELAAVQYAPLMLEAASKAAKEKGGYVAVNVLEERGGKLYNSTYLYDRQGSVHFVYDKIHLPPSEVALGMVPGDGACVCELDGIRFGFLTCYDIYFFEQIEHLAKEKVDLIVLPGYQRGERTDIIRAQTKLAAFRCNACVAKSSCSMEDDEKGGCSMIVAPDGTIVKDLGKEVGIATAEVDLTQKLMRPAGFGCGMILNDEFISNGLRPEVF